jgi:hypothetical protein
MIRFVLALTCLASPAFAQPVFIPTLSAVQAHRPSDSAVLASTKHIHRLPRSEGMGSGNAHQCQPAGSHCNRGAKATLHRLKKNKPAANQTGSPGAQ